MVGVLRCGPQRHIPPDHWRLCLEWGCPLLQVGSCPQLPAGSPQPLASSLASWPDLSPPPLSSSGSRLFFPSFLPLSSSPPLRGVCSQCPWPPVPGPCPSQMLLPGPPPPCPSWPSSGPLSVFPNDWILGVTGLYPCGCPEALEWLCGAGPGLPPLSLAYSPPFPPVWLAVQPPPSSPHLSNHRAPHLLLVNSGKKRGKKKEKQRNVELPPGLGPASQTGHMEQSRGQGWGGGPGLAD